MSEKPIECIINKDLIKESHKEMNNEYFKDKDSLIVNNKTRVLNKYYKKPFYIKY